MNIDDPNLTNAVRCNQGFAPRICPTCKRPIIDGACACGVAGTVGICGCPSGRDGDPGPDGVPDPDEARNILPRETQEQRFSRAAVTYCTCEAIYADANVSTALVDILTLGPQDDEGRDISGQGATNWERLAEALDKLQAAVDYMDDESGALGVRSLSKHRSNEARDRYREQIRQGYQVSSGRGLLRLPLVHVKE